MDWQDIGTAPKDGTVVMLYCPDSWDTDGIRVGWYDNEGWFDDEAASRKLTELYGSPTHWMPLPPPPHKQGEE